MADGWLEARGDHHDFEIARRATHGDAAEATHGTGRS